MREIFRSTANGFPPAKRATVYEVAVIGLALGWMVLAAAALFSLGQATLPRVLADCRAACAGTPLGLWMDHYLPSGGQAALAVMIAGSFGAAGAGAARCWLSTRRLRVDLAKRCRPLPVRLRRAIARLGIDEAMLLYVTDPNPLAFCGGLLRPRVVLSTGMLNRLSDAELRAVLRHELHHARRRDPLRAAGLRVLETALFPLPVLADLRRRWETAAEVAADAAALGGESTAALAGALLKSMRPAPLCPQAAASGFGATGPRIAHLAGRPAAEPRFSRPRVGISLALALVLVFAGVSSAAAQPATDTATCCARSVICPINH